jgi:hypothetical protein
MKMSQEHRHSGKKGHQLNFQKLFCLWEGGICLFDLQTVAFQINTDPSLQDRLKEISLCEASNQEATVWRSKRKNLPLTNQKVSGILINAILFSSVLICFIFGCILPLIIWQKLSMLLAKHFLRKSQFVKVCTM